MDHDKLRTASTYLNNLLLARGALRNGEPIDFVKPSKESRAQIINLVHDLILREDRDKEQREQAATSIRGLRAEDVRKTREIERLKTKSEESARATVQAQTGERVALTELKKVEKAMKILHDQAAKLKTSLAQVKTQCTNDVRKRDLELARLKTHLQGQQRGNRVGATGPIMTVRQTAERKITTGPASKHDLGDPEYSLKQETTEFLTQLSQSLSDENDSLINLIRNALTTTKGLLGLSANARRLPDSAVGSMGSEDEMHGNKQANTMLHSLPTSYEALSADMDSTIEHLKTVLTNPNYVSVEEVEVREEEIARLRAGWERMEQRWKDVLRMMEDWRRRMDTGDTINIDDLRRGMGLVSPSRERSQKNDLLPDLEQDQSFVESEASEIRLPEPDGELDSSMLAPEPPVHLSISRSSPKRKRDVLEPPEFFDLRPSTAGGSTSSPRGISREHYQSHMMDDDESEELEAPVMSIAEKLSAAQAEAEEAKAKARETSSKLQPDSKSTFKERSTRFEGSQDEPNDDTLGKMPSPMAKKTKIRGRPRKRKSTLLPDELEALINTDDVT